jgi:hypothetical protein
LQLQLCGRASAPGCALQQKPAPSLQLLGFPIQLLGLAVTPYLAVKYVVDKGNVGADVSSAAVRCACGPGRRQAAPALLQVCGSCCLRCRLPPAGTRR